MAPRTVQQLFGFKDPEVNMLTVLSGLEGYRGHGGKDTAAVAANALSRMLSGQWGGKDIGSVIKAPGQYEAVFKYSKQQLADPAFGAKVLGGQDEYNRIRNLVNNPYLVKQAYEASRGAQSFRGTAAYAHKKPTDYVPVPGKSNYYFDPLDKTVYNKGLQLFGGAGAPPAKPKEVSSALGLENLVAGGNLFGKETLENIMKQGVQEELLTSLIQPEEDNTNLFAQLLNQTRPY